MAFDRLSPAATRYRLPGAGRTDSPAAVSR